MAVETTIPGRPAARPAPVTRKVGALKVIRVIWQREMIVYIRDKARVISSLVFPVLLLVIFGEGLGQTVGGVGQGVNYRQFIFPGVVAQTILFTATFSGTTIIWDRQFGFLREILVAPISRSAIGIGKLMGGASVALIQASVVLLLAPVVGIHLSVGVILQLLVVMSVMALAMTGVGIALASRVKSVESFQMITQLTIMPSMFLSGMFFPVNNVPSWMEVLIKVNPITYGVAAIRTIALDKELTAAAGISVTQVEVFGHTMSTLESLGVLAVFGVLMLAIAVQSFQRSE
ncbi:MAG TPA: ABC transporter permease [Dehalococcoidia bacterium]|nr:ABC transporter permease [Dehalococcoidia bacterium]